jgi:Ca2+-binding RTX toxin-like protein
VPGAQNTIHAGIDTLISIENLTGSSFNDSLTGNTGANILSGADGNDTLSGGTGSDTLDGGAGTDTASFAGNAVFVTVALVAGPQNTGAGSDTLIGIENLTGSSFADSLTGDANANLLRGGDGNDTLNGRAGDDTLDGGNGIDTDDYTGAAAGVTVAVVAGAQNTGGSGIDTLVGIENLTGSGNNDTLTGNGSNNVLSGNSGADSLFGLDGSDTLLGGIGGDLLVGGLGRDFLTGGSSGDIFDFNAVSETGTSSVTRDQILDFVQGSDHIDLSTIDANTLVGGDQAFAFIGAAAFSGVAGQLRSAAGANTIVMGDINGDSVADFQIQLNGNFVLTAANFVA